MRFLKKRWHSIPIALVAVLLALALTTGGVLAAYGFLTATLSVEVGEAIAVGTWDTWDNLDPYGSVDDVEITLSEVGGNPVLTISTKATTPYVGEGFVAGEWIVIPVNIRNAGDGLLTLTASVSGGGGLDLEYIWQENPGPVSSWGPEDQPLCREFKATSGPWEPLNSWSVTIPGNSGESGSAVVGAQVLFVRISAPGSMVPGTYTFVVTLSRS